MQQLRFTSVVKNYAGLSLAWMLMLFTRQTKIFRFLIFLKGLKQYHYTINIIPF